MVMLMCYQIIVLSNYYSTVYTKNMWSFASLFLHFVFVYNLKK